MAGLRGIAERCAGDAGDDAKDGAQAVVDAVDGVADPRARLLAALVALGQQLVEDSFGIDLWRACRCMVVAAQERTEFAVVVFFIFDDVLEDGDGALVAETLELLAVAGDVAALFDFEPAQGHADAAGARGQRVGRAAGAAFINGFGPAQLADALGPQRRVLHFGRGEMAQYLGAHGIAVAVGERAVGVVALHFGLPVGLKSGQDLSGASAAQQSNGHAHVSLPFC